MRKRIPELRISIMAMKNSDRCSQKEKRNSRGKSPKVRVMKKATATIEDS